MEYRFIRVEKGEGIAKVTLHRPEVLNALNTPLLRELRTALEEIAGDGEVRVVILTGAGRAFSAGMDLKALGEPPPPGEPDPLFVAVETFEALERLPQPVIAAVNGYAITGGMELALCCDILIASEKAVFGDTHARVGVVPGGGNTQRLPRTIGMSRAKELLFASDYLSAPEALSLGLVSRVVPAEQLEETVQALAKKIAANDPATVQKVKALVNQGARLPLGEGMLLERSEFYRQCLRRQPQQVAARRPEVIARGRVETRKVQQGGKE